MDPTLQRFHQTLQNHSYRITEPRKIIFSILREADSPLPLRQIVNLAGNINRASIYRSLSLFESLGVINVVPVGWKRRFELAAPYKSHHHHIHCEQCGRVASIRSLDIENHIRIVAQQQSFRLRSHSLELTGLCGDCQTKKA